MTCTACTRDLPESDFYPKRHQCKSCVVDRVVKHRRKHWADEVARRKLNPESKATRDGRIERARRLNAERRLTIIAAYGGSCACCGEAEPAFLCIDHKAEDGAAERSRSGGTGSGWLRRIIADGFPDRYQVLCFNCNWTKSHGGCPHGSPAGQPGGGWS